VTDVAAAADLLVEPLQRIGAPDLPSVLGREAVVREHIVLGPEEASDQLGEAEVDPAAIAPVLSAFFVNHEVLRLAAQIASTCAAAYQRASEKTRRLFNNAVFEAVLVRDGKAAEARCCEPFDLLFSSRRFEYGDLAGLALQNANLFPTVEGPQIHLSLLHARARVAGLS
jgi:hypothetical protein